MDCNFNFIHFTFFVPNISNEIEKPVWYTQTGLKYFEINHNIIFSLEFKYENDDDVVLVKINIDNNQEFAQGLQIMSIPTMMFFVDGKRVVFQGEDGKSEDRIVGFYPNIDEIIINFVEQIKNPKKE